MQEKYHVAIQNQGKRMGFVMASELVNVHHHILVQIVRFVIAHIIARLTAIAVWNTPSVGVCVYLDIMVIIVSINNA